MKHRRRLLNGFLFMLALSAPLLAEVDFYSYQKTVSYDYIPFDTGFTVDTITRFSQILIGTSQLGTSEILINPRGAYLDIVEDAWISGNMTDLNEPDLFSSFMLQGLLSLPQNATVVGLETWKGDTMYRSQLHQAKYTYNSGFQDSMSVEKSLDNHIAMIQQVTETQYQVTFCRVSVGERKHVRIRYLLPNSGNGNAPYSVPVLFNSQSGTPPKFIKLTVHADATDKKYSLTTVSSSVELRDSSTLMIPYQPQFTLTYVPNAVSTLHLTSFSTGPFKGSYLLLNTALTDSTLQKLSKPIQTVFLWRWNAPQQIVTFNGQIKGLSSYAYSVINQAKSIKQTVTSLQKRGYQCALLHSIEGKSGLAYQTTVISDSSSSQINSYLGTFNEQALFAAYINQSDPTPGWVPSAAGSTPVIQTAQQDFLSLLRTAVRLLADTSVAYRHVVLVTSGDAAGAYASDFKENADSILAHTSIDPTNSQWRGVDVTASLPSVYNQSLMAWGAFYFPAFTPVTVQLKIKTSEEAFTFPISSVDMGDFAVSARISGTWDTALTWMGYDQSGNITSTLLTRPVIFREQLDSGVAKIWAHDESHIAEVEETYPGGTFGIVTKSTFLQATIKDIGTIASNGIPFLEDFEILAPRTSQRSQIKAAALRGMAFSFHGGVLTLINAGDLRKLEVFDLSGRLLASVDLRAYRVAHGCYRIALRTIMRLAGHRVLLVKISGALFQKTIKLIPGGIR
jgi:hypothetical protein